MEPLDSNDFKTCQVANKVLSSSPSVERPGLESDHHPGRCRRNDPSNLCVVFFQNNDDMVDGRNPAPVDR